MTNRLTHQPFGAPPFPRRIEDDPMFSGWSRDLPRLWYLDQRQATRLDAETLFAGSQYAVFYNRTQFTTLAEPVQDGAVGAIGFYREFTTDIGVPIQTAGREVDYSRTVVTALDQPNQTHVIVRPSGSPINPIVHPMLGADSGSGPPPIEASPLYTVSITVGTPAAGSILLYTLDRLSKIVGVRARRTGGTDVSFNITYPVGQYVLGIDLSTPIADVWLAAPVSEVGDEPLADTTELTLVVNEVVGTVTTLEIDIDFEVVVEAPPE